MQPGAQLPPPPPPPHLAVAAAPIKPSPVVHIVGGILTVVAAVPAMTVYVSRHRQQPWKPWLAIAAALMLMGIAIALRAEPQTGFCF